MNQIASAGNRGDKVRSDCHVTVELKGNGGIVVNLNSRVESMYGDQIRRQVLEIFKGMEISNADVEIEDSGALPFVIAARIEAAVRQLVKGGLTFLPDFIPRTQYESRKDRFRFSRLYIPGNTPGMMLNAGIHKPDGIILDLEDSVSPEKKDEARILVRNALRQVDFYGAEKMVRINQLPMGLQDLDEIIPHQVHLILIPKCETSDQVEQVDLHVNKILSGNKSKGDIYYMPIIESALGVENAFEIAGSNEKVVSMAIGLEDLTADLGVQRTAGGEESLYARTRVVNACKAAGIQPIDSVFSDVADMESLKANVIRSKSLGFEGMGCIHPRQVKVIREGFCPDENEIAKAEKIVQLFEDAQKRGLGVVAMGTKMIDPPVVKRAQRTLELACQFGLRSDPAHN